MKYLILHHGFAKPSPEDMAKWNAWFDSIADRQVERGHFPVGLEISANGVKELPFAADSITGYTMITADDLDHAESIARECPCVDATRVYEIRG